MPNPDFDIKLSVPNDIGNLAEFEAKITIHQSISNTEVKCPLSFEATSYDGISRFVGSLVGIGLNSSRTIFRIKYEKVAAPPPPRSYGAQLVSEVITCYATPAKKEEPTPGSLWRRNTGSIYEVVRPIYGYVDCLSELGGFVKFPRDIFDRDFAILCKLETYESSAPLNLIGTKWRDTRNGKVFTITGFQKLKAFGGDLAIRYDASGRPGFLCANVFFNKPERFEKINED